MHLSAKRLLLLLVLLVSSSCGFGGGGGGGDPLPSVRGAIVTISADPSSMQIGDRVLVHTIISDIDSDGVLITLRFPTSLSYVDNSSSLRIDGDQVAISALGTGTAKKAKTNFVGYYFPYDTFGGGTGELYFELRATAAAEDAAIEIDQDTRDETLTPLEQFDANTDLFGAEDATYVQIEE